MSTPTPAQNQALTRDELRAALTDKQFLWTESYLGVARFNGTRAARLAGYGGDDNTLAVMAHDNLRNPKIRAYIDAVLGEAVMSRNEVLARLSDLADANIAYFLDVPETTDEEKRDHPRALQHRARLNLAKAAAAGKLHLLKTFEGDEYGRVKIALHDPLAALTQLGRYHKLFTDKVEHSGSIRTEGIDLTKLTDDEIDALDKLTQKAAAGQPDPAQPDGGAGGEGQAPPL